MMFFKNKPVTDIGAAPEIEHDGLNLAMHESFCDFEKIKGMIPTALSNVYEMYVLDTNQTTAQKTAVLEGVLSDAWEKIRSFFKKIAEKLKSWWNAAVKYFQTIFSSNESFLKKFKEDISGKDGSKFSYTGYEFKGTGAAEVTAAAKKSNESSKKAFDEMVKLASGDLQKAKDESSDKVKEKKKEIDKIWMGLVKKGADTGNVSKFKEALEKGILGGEKKEIIGFSKGLSVSQMIDLLENGGDTLSELKDIANDISENADKYADEVDSMVGKFRQGEEDATKRSNYSNLITAASTVAKYDLSYATAAVDVVKATLSEKISQSSSVLRSFARYKEPTKDSYTPSTGNKTSMLEAFAGGW